MAESTPANGSEESRRPVFLICTVGGSPQPIATALRDLRPAVVWFLVSDGSNGESSRSQVENAEIEYDKRRGTRGPGLRFVDGCPATTKVLPIPADDPDGAYAMCRSHLAEARRRYADHRLIADYTGGTKSMTGALLMAAFAQPGFEVQFMAGERRDLVQVRSGSERPQIMSADFIMAERDFAAAEQAVAGLDYGAANRLLRDLRHRLWSVRASTPQSFCDRLDHASVWTKVMASWDAFKHRDAAAIAHGAHKHGTWLGLALERSGHLQPLLALGKREERAPGWDLCADLWLNALRRGERGRYDDAVARLYRLVEAAAQAWLWSRHELKSSEIPMTRLPDEMRDLAQRRNGQRAEHTKLALNDTVALLRHLAPDDRFAAAYIGERIGEARPEGPPWLSLRNNSILAHGFESVSERVWKQAKEWTETNIRPFFQLAEFPQLPRAIPALQDTAV